MNIWLRFLHLINSVTLGTIRRVQEAPAFRPVILGCFFNARCHTECCWPFVRHRIYLCARTKYIPNEISRPWNFSLDAVPRRLHVFKMLLCARERKIITHTHMSAAEENFCPRLTEINYLRIQLRECQKGVVMNRFGWIDGATESDSPPATNTPKHVYFFCGLNGLLMKEDIHLITHMQP
jgi:hypothetical protein